MRSLSSSWVNLPCQRWLSSVGEWAFNSEQHSSGLKATLYKNIPMEKACIHGYEGFVAPYDHPPPAVYKPVPGHYTADEFLA